MKRLVTVLCLASLGFVLFPSSAAYCAAPGPGGGTPSAEEKAAQKEQMEMKRETKRAEELRKAKEREEMLKRPAPEIKMAYIKGGCYQMGDFVGEGDDDERPVHEACVGDYYMAQTEVTVGQWNYVMYDMQLKNVDPNLPITNVSYAMANDFITVLNKMSKKRYRLPTEAEWEYAAREKGRNLRWSGTDDDYELNDYAWFIDNSDEALHPVGQKKPNSLGLYDMSGNAAEWVDDYFDFDFYKKSEKIDPYDAVAVPWKVVRGGSAFDSAYKCRTVYRYSFEYSASGYNIGFRLAQ